MRTIIPWDLTPAQLSMASHIAVMRRISNWQNPHLKPKYGATDGWENDIVGCGAELAVALYLNLVWCGTVNKFRERDVGHLVDVRSTTEPDRRLILHDEDPDPVPFVLVWPRGRIGCYSLVGWYFAHEGKQEKWWSDPTGRGRPAYFVSHEVLEDMTLLLDWVRSKRAEEEDEDEEVV